MDSPQSADDTTTIWVFSGPNLRSDSGALFRSQDGGMNWERVDMGVQLPSTPFTLAFDDRRPSTMFRAQAPRRPPKAAPATANLARTHAEFQRHVGQQEHLQDSRHLTVRQVWLVASYIS